MTTPSEDFKAKKAKENADRKAQQQEVAKAEENMAPEDLLHGVPDQKYEGSKVKESEEPKK